MKVIIIVLLLLVVASLFMALFSLVKDKGQSDRTVKFLSSFRNPSLIKQKNNRN